MADEESAPSGSLEDPEVPAQDSAVPDPSGASKGPRLTIKHGRGAVRVEEELALDDRQAESLWKLTEGRRLEKTRRSMHVQGVEVEVDEYAGPLDDLVVPRWSSPTRMRRWTSRRRPGFSAS